MPHVAVFGASSGVGLALVQRLALHGAVTAVSRRGPPEAERSAETGTVRWLPCDVRDAEQIDRLFARHGDDFEMVVNCVGIGAYAPFEQGFAPYWQDIVSTNLLGAVHILAATAKRAPRCSHVLGVGSLAARRPSPTPGNDVYAASKLAFERLHEDFRLRLHQDGRTMKVTVVTPGFIGNTDFGHTFFRSAPDLARDLYTAFQPLQPDDVAASVEWCLARPDHVEITGLTLRPMGQ